MGIVEETFPFAVVARIPVLWQKRGYLSKNWLVFGFDGNPGIEDFNVFVQFYLLIYWNKDWVHPPRLENVFGGIRTGDLLIQRLKLSNT